MRTRLHPFAAGPSTRRHRLASRASRLALALERLERRWVPSGLAATQPVPAGAPAADVDGGVPGPANPSARPSLASPSARGILTPPTTADAPPRIDSISNNGPVPAGTPVTVTVAAHDTNGSGKPLTYLFDFLDDGTFEASNTSGVASETYDVPGLHVVHIRVIAAENDRTDAMTFVVVQSPPPSAPPANQEVAVEETSTSFDLGGFPGFGTPGGGAWSVSVDWGDGTSPSTFSTSSVADLGRVPHTYARYGTYPVNVTVRSMTGVGQEIFFADVRDVSPSVSSPGDQSATEGAATGFALGGFADPGDDAPWQVTVDWGDGTSPSTFSAATAGDLGSLPHTYARFGSYSVTVAVDDGQAIGLATFHADVQDVSPAPTPPPDQSATEGTPMSFALGGFADPGSDAPWTVTVDWGDGTGATTFITPAVGDLGDLTHTFARYGTYPITITVDDGQTRGSASFRADVRDVLPTAVAPSDESATEGTSASFDLGGFSDPGSDAPWRVTVDWGDGTAPTSFTTPTAGDLGSLPHTYARYGTYPVTVVVDDGQSAGSVTFHADVRDVPPTVTSPPDQHGVEGSAMGFALGGFADPGSDAPWTVTVDWGDGTGASTFTASAAGDLGSLAHVYARSGTYSVSITVGDGMAIGSSVFHADIQDVSLQFQGPQPSPSPGPPSVPATVVSVPTPPQTAPAAGLFNPISLVADLTIVSVGLPVQQTGPNAPPAPGGFQVPIPISQSIISGTGLQVSSTAPPPADGPSGAGAVAAPTGAGGVVAAPASSSAPAVAKVVLPPVASADPAAQAAGGTTTSSVTTTSSASPPDPPNPGGAMTLAIMMIAILSYQQRDRYRVKIQFSPRGARP